MKILFIRDHPPVRGGESTYALTFKEIMEKRGHKVEIIYHDYQESNLLKSLYWQHLYSLFSLSWKKKIEEKVEDFRPDLIHIMGIGNIISPYCLKKVSQRVPIVFTISGAKQFHYFGQWDDEVRKNSFKLFSNITYFRLLTLIPKKFLHRNFVIDITDHFIAPSPLTAKLTKDEINISEEKISVIRHPALFPIKNDVPQKGDYFLYVGRLNKEKGVKYLINAFQIIDNHVSSNTKLLIIGDGPEKEKLKNLTSRLNISKKVKFLGRVPHKDLIEIYSGALFNVLPSIVKENSPLTPLEAMSQGTPVITTNFGGQKVLVKDGYNGLLAEPENAKDLAEKLQKILTDDNLRIKLSKNSIKYAKGFTKEKHGEELERLFDRLIKKYRAK